MPSWKEHKKLCEQLLGDGYSNVHRAKDFGYAWLGGKHRRVGHGMLSNLALGVWFGDWRAALAGVIHDVQDFSSPSARRRRLKPHR